jgi:hypothetical protein
VSDQIFGNRDFVALMGDPPFDPLYPIVAMTSDPYPHLVNIAEVKSMTVAELIQRLADHEKQYTDQLKAEAVKREEERAKQSRKAPKKRTKHESIKKRRR